MANTHKYVYLFSEGNGSMRELLGGKGANLAEMTNLGMPVPQGFTVTTEACTQYYEDGQKINDGIQAEIMEYITKLEGITGKKFGDLETMRQAYEEWPLFSTFIDNIEMSLAKTDERIAKMYLALGDREDLNKKVLDEMELTRKWVLEIVGDKWPLQHRHVLGQAIRIRSPYVDALSATQVLALGSLRKRVDKEELTHGQKENYTYLILCTVSGVAAGLQNTG